MNTIFLILYESKWKILFLSLILPSLFIVLNIFYAVGDKNTYLNTVVKVNQTRFTLHPNALITESLINEALTIENIKVPADQLVQFLTVTIGYKLLNEQIDDLLKEMTDGLSVTQPELREQIENKYLNLIATQNSFLTIHYNLHESPLNRVTAERLISSLIKVFNEKFATGEIRSEPVLNEIDLADFDLFDGFSSYTLYAFNGLLDALEKRNDKLVEVKFSKNGFNNEIIKSQIRSLRYELKNIIASNPIFRAYFLQLLDRDLNILEKKINVVNSSLKEIGNQRELVAGIQLSPSSDRGQISAEYNGQILDRFLSLGATVSFVEFQEQLLNQRLKLAFRQSELEEQKASYLDKAIQKNFSKLEFEFCLKEAKNLTNQLNGFIKSYNQDFQKNIVTPIKSELVQPARLFSIKALLVVMFISFGLIGMSFIVVKQW